MSSGSEALPETMGDRKISAVVIGASAGAVEALSVILPALPATWAIPVFIVVHLPPDRESILPQLFQPKCRVRVTEAEDKAVIDSKTIYFAPSNYHLLIEQNGTLSLSVEEPVLFSRPSIDVLFETASDAFGERLLAVVLTGANSDGANGLRSICEAGGVAVVQRPETAQASMMPQAALDACPKALTMGLSEIAAFLIRLADIREA